MATEAGALAARLREVQAEREALQISATTIRATATKLKRLVGLGFLDETDLGLFTPPGQQDQTTSPTSDPDQD